MKRVDIKAILKDPALRRRLMASTIKATQEREGIETTWERAYEVADQARREKEAKP